MTDTEIPMSAVVNRCYGSYSLSQAATKAIAYRKGITLYEEGGYLYVNDQYDTFACTLPRTDPDLVAVVRSLGPAAAGGGSTELEVVDFTVSIGIESDDGIERLVVHGGSY